MPTLRDFPCASLIFETSHCHWQEELTRRLSRPAGRSLLGAEALSTFTLAAFLLKPLMAIRTTECEARSVSHSESHTSDSISELSRRTFAYANPSRLPPATGDLSFETPLAIGRGELTRSKRKPAGCGAYSEQRHNMTFTVSASTLNLRLWIPASL